MLVSSISTAVSAIALFTASANALPWPSNAATYTPASDLSRVASLMPSSDLPAPNGQLKYIVLGIGTQNYTCTTGNPDAAPGTTGALAALYDIGSKLNNDPMAMWKIASLSPLALALSAFPSTLEWSLKSQGYDKRIGTHEFKTINGAGTPTFILDELASPFPMAQVSKLNDTAAPASACPGLQNEGSVKWLYLKDTKGLSKGGIDTVYRIETAGGSPPATCKDQPASFEVKYAAQYWIFGPRK